MAKVDFLQDQLKFILPVSIIETIRFRLKKVGMTTTAFFDLDYTLLSTSSGMIYVREIIRQRRAPWWVVSYLGMQYKLKQLDFGQVHGRLITHVGQRGLIKLSIFLQHWQGNISSHACLKRAERRLSGIDSRVIAW